MSDGGERATGPPKVERESVKAATAIAKAMELARQTGHTEPTELGTLLPAARRLLRKAVYQLEGSPPLRQDLQLGLA